MTTSNKSNDYYSKHFSISQFDGSINIIASRPIVITLLAILTFLLIVTLFYFDGRFFSNQGFPKTLNGQTVCPNVSCGFTGPPPLDQSSYWGTDTPYDSELFVNLTESVVSMPSDQVKTKHPSFSERSGVTVSNVGRPKNPFTELKGRLFAFLPTDLGMTAVVAFFSAFVVAIINGIFLLLSKKIDKN
jgi:hypothetical protein